VKRDRQPALITDAQRSPSEQLRRREIRYVLMMSLRALCVILGGVLVMVRAPLLGLWLPLCGVGMVLLPWLAVILANDRAPKEEHRLSHRFRRTPQTGAAPPQALPGPRDNQRIIDADE